VTERAFGPGLWRLADPKISLASMASGRITPAVVFLSLPLGALIGAFLWINEFPDYEADRAASKRTLVVRLGRPRAARVFAAIVTSAFGATALLPLVGLPAGVLLGLVAVPFGIAAALRLMREPEVTARIVPAQAWTLLCFVLTAMGSGLGLWL
jgi:1,4-dihydroxy-2-naphthoate octaprenyltransferase